MSSEYHAAYSPFSKTIYVGRASKRDPIFLEKQDRTDEVIAVVGEYVRGAFGDDGQSGGMEATFEGLDMRITIRVHPIAAKMIERGEEA